MSQQAVIFQQVSFKLYGFTMHPFIPFFQTTPCEEGRSPVQILGVALLLCILACVPRSMLVFEPRFGPKHPKTTTHVAQGGDIMCIYYCTMLGQNHQSTDLCRRRWGISTLVIQFVFFLGFVSAGLCHHRKVKLPPPFAHIQRAGHFLPSGT